MAHDNLRFVFFFGGGRGESRGRTGSGPTPSILEALVCGERPEGVCWHHHLFCILLTTIFFKEPFPRPPTPSSFRPSHHPQSPQGRGSTRGWRAGSGELGAWPGASLGEWRGAPGAGIPRSGPQCCSGCGTSRNLGKEQRQGWEGAWGRSQGEGTQRPQTGTQRQREEGWRGEKHP